MRHEARMAASGKRMAAREKYVEAVEKRLDKRMDGIAKLLKTGMHMLANDRAESKRNNAEIRQSIEALVEAQMRSEARMDRLAAAQEDTHRTLKAFIESMRKGGNGRPKGRNGH